MTEYGKTLQPIEQGQSGSSNQWKIRYLYRRLASTIANYGDFLCATKKLSMAVQFKKTNVIEDDEDGLHVQYQSISYEHSWKSLEEYVGGPLQKALHCSALGDKKLGTKSICEHVQIILSL